MTAVAQIIAVAVRLKPRPFWHDAGMVTGKGKRWVRRSAKVLLALIGSAAVLVGASWVALWVEYGGTPGARARGTGHDAAWLGHAWVDGRKSQSDVDDLVMHLRSTGIRDLFVHTGPFNHDGTLDPGRRSQGGWFTPPSTKPCRGSGFRHGWGLIRYPVK